MPYDDSSGSDSYVDAEVLCPHTSDDFVTGSGVEVVGIQRFIVV